MDGSGVRYVIEGGRRVRGEITCLGAKNFATKAMVAALLTDEPSWLLNAPPIGDVEITARMLRSIGVDVTHEDDTTIRLDASGVRSSEVTMPDSQSNRIPILLLGALLHRFERVSVPRLGGCRIGARKTDFHHEAIRRFGGEVEQTPGGFVALRRRRLTGTRIELPYPSVGATETCLFLAVLAEGRTVISNAAIEPEIRGLILMLQMMGAIIFTSPGRDITIEGVPRLRGVRMPVLGDRIEAGSWACLAAACDGEITVHGIRPDTLGNFLSYFQQVGGGVRIVGERSLCFTRRGPLRPAMIETNVYPGFSTDWQQPFAILLTQADGISVIHETVYENRFGYLRDLAALGARAQLTSHCLGSHPCRFRDTSDEHSAVLSGPVRLEGGPITIPDLRAGLAYVIAAAIAEGSSELDGVGFLERGYGNIVPRLTRMGVRIDRVGSEPPAAATELDAPAAEIDQPASRAG